MENPSPIASNPLPTAVTKPALRDARGRPYEPAIGPRLKVLLLAFIFPSVALLGATGVYLLAIRLLEWSRTQTYTNQFTLGMFIAHVAVGILLVIPFLAFGFTHLATARHRKNRLAVRLGISLFITSIVVGLTGLALIQLDVRFLNIKLPQLPTRTPGRTVVYLLHALAPVAAVGLYVLHRRAGPDIQYRWGVAWGLGVGVFVLAMGLMHSLDPRPWYAKGSPEGEEYFEPSKARTVDGKFISTEALLMDEYCLKCHQDIYNSHVHSVHKFSSFNNPAYAFSVLETRRVAFKRDGNTRASRWCAGCHDPVPFLGGGFDKTDLDDPSFDVRTHPTAGAGITCTVCHAIVNINSRMGNADYTIEEPLHYPFANSDSAFLQWVNNQVVKAKPEFHKKTFLKDFHRTEAFCSTCHKVSIPMEVNSYKEFLRGQNHSDPFLLSGVSGSGARSFYYPPVAKTRCAECHMPLQPSGDFGRQDFDGSGERKVHSHLQLGANTGVPALTHFDGWEKIAKAQADFLRGTDPDGKDRKVRIDLFGIKEGGGIDGKLVAPLRPQLPALKPGATYLVEVVIRTLNVGHPFTQGTVDSNEIWVDFEARSGERVIGRSGALSNPDDSGKVDEWSHFINVLMLDRRGNRIDRRNPQDIFTPLYNHQIPPGAGQVVHYKLDVPHNVTGSIDLKVRVRYRKFDYTYLRYVYPKGEVPKLPIVDLCEDRVTLPVAGVADKVAEQTSPIKPAWQRWNDYGIGCYLEGEIGSKKGELRQAREAFQHLLTLGQKDAEGHAYLNLARVAFDEGRLDDAALALNKASQTEPPAPWWTVSWFNGLVNAQNGHLDRAIIDFENILDPAKQPRERKFDFTKDYVVIDELGKTLFKRAQREPDESPEREKFLLRAVEQYRRTLQIDPEDLEAHYGLAQCYGNLSDSMPTTAAQRPQDGADEAGLLSLAKLFVAGQEPNERRLEAAARLNAAVIRYGEQPAVPGKPKLPTLKALMQQCRPVFDESADAGVRGAAALVLSSLHRQAHAIYRPDENAQARAVRIYRSSHPAANLAAEAIVIYPLHRQASPAVPAE